jgi:putative CRISPR-associated protein (TIGR02619 family)
MPRTLLLTTGTSIANGTAALSSYQRRATSWEEEAVDLREQIRERLKGFDLGAEAGRVRASAELNILHRLPVQPDDEVVLFSTDTAEGRACTEELKRVVEAEFAVANVAIERVQGLQVRDADTLRHTGLSNLTRRLIHYLEDPQRQYTGGCVLCPNGGFKGVVPFLTVLGMIFRAPVVYVFEFAETVISLPPLPLELASDLFERALPALSWADAAGIFEVGEFQRRIPGFLPEEAPLFESFLEIVPDATDGRLGSLSPLISALSRRGPGGETLRISERAQRELAGLDATLRSEVEHHLQKLTSPIWRSQHRDSKFNSNLEYYPRGHNPWRFAGYTEDGQFHLCWFAQHDAYDRLIPHLGQRVRFSDEPFSDYTPQSPADSPPAADDPYRQHTWSDLRSVVAKLETENQKLASRERDANLNANRLQSLHHEARRSIDELNDTNRELRDRLRQLEESS